MQKKKLIKKYTKTAKEKDKMILNLKNKGNSKYMKH
jgi:hypothetical protein